MLLVPLHGTVDYRFNNLHQPNMYMAKTDKVGLQQPLLRWPFTLRVLSQTMNKLAISPSIPAYNTAKL